MCTLNVHEWAKELVAVRKATMFQVSALFLNRPSRLVFGDFLLVEKLASGGMGEVYKAVRQSDGAAAVVKLLPAKSAADEEMVRRFRPKFAANAPSFQGLAGTGHGALHPSITGRWDV